MPEYTRKLVAEFLGTYVLLAFGGFAIFGAKGVGEIIPGQGSPLIVIALGFGLALLVGLYAFGEVSGGHFNPAVSLGALIDQRIDLGTFVMYAIAQVAGAILAGLTLAVAISQRFVASTATLPGVGVSAWDAFFLEILFTAFFVAVILKVTASKDNAVTAFLGISLTLVVIHLAAVTLTGSSVNPARSLGSAIVGDQLTDLWVYVTAPFVGAFIGWALYKLVTLREEDATQVPG